jgi:type II secretory pathway pseudopilin PulG
MKRASTLRRGFLLAVVLVVMTLVGAAITAMTVHATDYYRHGQVDRATLIAQALQASVRAYAVAHPEHLTPGTSLALPVDALLPANFQGSAVIDCEADGQGAAPTCRAVVRVDRGPYHVERELHLGPATATRPAATRDG